MRTNEIERIRPGTVLTNTELMIGSIVVDCECSDYDEELTLVTEHGEITTMPLDTLESERGIWELGASKDVLHKIRKVAGLTNEQLRRQCKYLDFAESADPLGMPVFWLADDNEQAEECLELFCSEYECPDLFRATGMLTRVGLSVPSDPEGFTLPSGDIVCVSTMVDELRKYVEKRVTPEGFGVALKNFAKKGRGNER